MKIIRDIMIVGTVLFASVLTAFLLLVKPHRDLIASSRATRHQCELARMDGKMLVDLTLSPSSLDRDSVHGVYDYVRLEQRQCALFTVPAVFHCQTNECRAAELASMNVVMP